jgi:hypothetical protein
MSRGVFYIAIGDAAEREYEISCRSLKKHNNNLEVAVCRDAGGRVPLAASRFAKLNIFDATEWQQIMYLDADTRVKGDVSLGFDILDDGWDMVICPSSNQGNDVLCHVDEAERGDTFAALGFVDVLQLQAGVFWVARNERTEMLWSTWRAEWMLRQGQDQGALLRALYQEPVKVWLLGSEHFNDRRRNKGAVVEHHFGRAR